jgi:hypothetical protein
VVPSADRDDGRLWYGAVMARLMDPRGVPPCQPPDGDALARSLLDVEALPSRLRSVLLRTWVDVALTISQRARLRPDAADALRLLSGLLDSPVPLELARHYREVEWHAADDAAPQHARTPP